MTCLALPLETWSEHAGARCGKFIMCADSGICRAPSYETEACAACPPADIMMWWHALPLGYTDSPQCWFSFSCLKVSMHKPSGSAVKLS